MVGSLELIATCIVIPFSFVILQHLFLSATKDEPPFVKGPIPFLGSAFAYLRDPQQFLNGLQKKYGPIFTVYIAGERMTFLADPKIGNRQVLNNRSSLSFLHFQQKYSQSFFGYTKSVAMDLDFQQKLIHQINTVMSSKPLLAEITQTIRTTYLGLIDNSRYSNCNGEVIDLYHFCRYNMYYSSARALFGPGFPFEEIYQPYLCFEDDLPKFARRYPRFLNSKGYKEQQKVLDELGSFVMDPSRIAQSSALIRSLHDICMASTHKSPADIAGFFFSVLLASKSNSIPAAFWTLANIVADAGIKAEIQEIIPKYYIAEKDDFDWNELQKVPLITSCFKETLRLYGNGVSTRQVMEDFTLRVGNPSDNNAKDMRLRAGSAVLMPMSMTHWNPDVYPTPMEWVGRRFLEENQGVWVHGGDKLHAYTPWGGGAYICPGRHLAFEEAVIQLVYVLSRFDIEPIKDIPSFVVDDRYGTGVFRPAKSYHVKFTTRTVAAPLQS
ncbi:cytochrome P450 [Lipomyces starkeyi]